MEKIDYLFVHVPKRSNFYKPLNEFMLVNYIPVGTLMLADLMEKSGHRSKLIHVGLEFIKNPTFSIVNWIKNYDIKIIGLPIHWHYQSFDVIEVARKIKENVPHIHINLGGFTASRFAEEIIKDYKFIDSVVVGDGEKPALQLIDAIKSMDSFSDVQNLVWRDGDKVINNGITFIADEEDLKGLNYTNFSLMEHADEYVKNFSVPLFWMVNASESFNRKVHFDGARLFPLPVGRGCSVNCSFCGGSRDTLIKISGRRKPVFRPVEDVITSIIEAKAAGYTSLNVSFDPYPAKYQYWVDLFNEVATQKIDIDMFFECWGLPVPEFINAFKVAFPGKKSAIALSVETGSEELRKKSKGIFYDNNALYEALEYLKSSNITTYLYFTIGLAGETKADSQKTKDLIADIRKKYSSVVADILLVPIQVEPGAPIFENPDKYNVKCDRESFKDFYNAHKSYKSNPYTDLGYSSSCYFNKDLTSEEFSDEIAKIRCRDFCIISPKIFGKPFPFLGRFICKFRHAFWMRKGFGKAPSSRPEFN